ncbi:MAG: hypothetical protein H8E42_12265 [Nitrospinae bacterium]|nr:hypothetical protein [Nitrospinota bacterium]MBL7020750.1 hypothetical protein [Nitrospinaceae bacterium]
MRLLNALIALTIFLVPMQVQAGSSYDYQLYKNHENYGIVVFPKRSIHKELSDYIASLLFSEVQSGKAVMRRGSKNENETLMMPLEVQKKHSIEKFIVIQVLSQQEMLAGIYDPEWGLTLPSASFGMEALKQNIPKTLNAFRGDNPQRRTALEHEEKPGLLRPTLKRAIFVNFFREPGYNAEEIEKHTINAMVWR